MIQSQQSNEDQYDELEARKVLLEEGIRGFNRGVESDLDAIKNISGDLFDLTSENKTAISDFDALQTDFQSQGRAIKDLKAQKKPPIGQIKELEKQRRAISRRKNMLNKKIKDNSAKMDFLVVRIQHFYQQIDQLKVRIADSEMEIKRVKKAMPELGVHAVLDEVCDNVFNCTYAEFNEEFEGFIVPIKKELVNILDKAEPVLEFILENLYGRYTNIRHTLHNHRLVDLEMDAKNEAMYYLTLLESGVDEETAMKMLKAKFTSSSNIDNMLNGVVEKVAAKLFKLVD